MGEKLKYGCIGAGGIAVNKHLKGYAATGEVEITAICDPYKASAEKAAETFTIPKVYTRYEEMLEKESLDIVSVCTPNYLHAPAAIMALERGANVHCEKPLAMNASEAEAIVQAKDKSGKKLMVGLNNRFTNEASFVKKYAKEGLFGEIYHARCGWRRRRGIPGAGGWFTDKSRSGGGPLIDLGVHFLDLVMYFMDFPTPVSASGAVYSKFQDNRSLNSGSYGRSGDGIIDVEDLATAFVRLENRATISLEFSWASNIEKDVSYYELLGTKGGASFYNGELKIFTEVMGTCADLIPNTKYPRKEIDEFSHFIDCVKTGREPVAPPEEAVKMMKIIDAIYDSSEKNAEIRIN